MGGEPLLRPKFVHKVVDYAAKRDFWVYIATNGRLLRPDLADRLGDAGVSAFNFALDAWDLKPSLPKALVPARKNLEHILRQQYVQGYVVFFNINICRNNLEDVRLLTEYAHDHRVATDYHINEFSSEPGNRADFFRSGPDRVIVSAHLRCRAPT